MAEIPKTPSSAGSPGAANETWLASLGPLLFLAAIFLINFLSRIIFGPLLVEMERELNLGHKEAGALFLVITIGYSAALLGSGTLAARLTHRQLIIGSTLGLGMFLLLLSRPQPLWLLTANLLLLGLCAGIYLPSGMATLTSIVKPLHWGKAVAVHELAPNLGFVLAPFLAEAFLRWSSWRGLLLALSGCSLLLGLAYARYGRGGTFKGEAPTFQVVSVLLRDLSFWIMMVMFGLGIGTSFGVYAMLPLYLISERGLDRTWANTLIALSRVAGLLVAFGAGWFVDRWGVRKSLAIFFGATGVMTILLGTLAGPWLTAVVFLQPLVAVCFFPAGFTAIGRIGPPKLRNVAVGFTIPLGFMFGGGLIPTAIGWAGERGSFSAGIVGVGVVTLLCLPLIRLLKLTAIADQKH